MQLEKRLTRLTKHEVKVWHLDVLLRFGGISRVLTGLLAITRLEPISRLLESVNQAVPLKLFVLAAPQKSLDLRPIGIETYVMER